MEDVIKKKKLIMAHVNQQLSLMCNLDFTNEVSSLNKQDCTIQRADGSGRTQKEITG